MKLLIEYAGDMDDKDVGIRMIDVEFDKDTETSIKIGESETIKISSLDLAGKYFQNPEKD